MPLEHSRGMNLFIQKRIAKTDIVGIILHFKSSFFESSPVPFISFAFDFPS